MNESQSTFNISFNNISRDNYYFELQIKVHVVIKSYFLNEEYLIYSLPIDLKKYLEKNNSSHFFYIILGLVGAIVIIIIIFLILTYRFKKKNSELKDKVLSISFSSGLKEELPTTDIKDLKKDEEYESTFI